MISVYKPNPADKTDMNEKHGRIVKTTAEKQT